MTTVGGMNEARGTLTPVPLATLYKVKVGAVGLMGKFAILMFWYRDLPFFNYDDNVYKIDIKF